jgi:hypothetical protein
VPATGRRLQEILRRGKSANAAADPALHLQGAGTSAKAFFSRRYITALKDFNKRWVSAVMRAHRCHRQPEPQARLYVLRRAGELSIRMGLRRYTRLTNGHSKKLENHCAALAIYSMHYNFARLHQTIRCSPAMAAGVTPHLWSVDEIVALLPVEAHYPDPRRFAFSPLAR